MEGTHLKWTLKTWESLQSTEGEEKGQHHSSSWASTCISHAFTGCFSASAPVNFVVTMTFFYCAVLVLCLSTYWSVPESRLPIWWIPFLILQNLPLVSFPGSCSQVWVFLSLLSQCLMMTFIVFGDLCI